MIIKSTENKIFKYILKFKNQHDDNNNELFLIEGKKQIDSIKKEWNVKCIIISEKYNNIITNFDNIIVFSEHLFNKLSSTKSPQGIMALIRKKKYNVNEIIKKHNKFIILENIQDPGNLGTIIRSADAFGMEAVFVSKKSANIYSDKTLRATMGSIFNIPVINNIKIKDIINYMKNEKTLILSTSLSSKKYINNIELKNKNAFIIGNESCGIKKKTESLADSIIKICTTGKTESLN
ncbi:MAG: RNA methyltransferase, partial [Endomicrobium sp.]|nr:RNA methyltransferase [Endomicrobium sp.]